MDFRPYEPLEMTTAKWRLIEPVEIPICLLIYSQANLYDGILEEGHSFCGDEFVHVVYYKGSFFLVDGHNRVERRKKNGFDFIMGRLKFKV
jgi:hypothetical protein